MHNPGNLAPAPQPRDPRSRLTPLPTPTKLATEMAKHAKTCRESRQAEIDKALREVDEIAKRIAQAWRSPKSAVELLQEQRR
jgi:hypothetical protein